MKNYNFDLAKKIINTFNELGVLESASLGMQEDMFWTCVTVFKNGEYTKELKEDTEIAGISGSRWATPIIQLELSNGETEVFECFSGEWTTDIEFRMNKMKTWASGSLSIETQLSMDKIEVKQFNPK